MRQLIQRAQQFLTHIKVAIILTDGSSVGCKICNRMLILWSEVFSYQKDLKKNLFIYIFFCLLWVFVALWAFL